MLFSSSFFVFPSFFLVLRHSHATSGSSGCRMLRTSSASYPGHRSPWQPTTRPSMAVSVGHASTTCSDDPRSEMTRCTVCSEPCFRVHYHTASLVSARPNRYKPASSQLTARLCFPAPLPFFLVSVRLTGRAHKRPLPPPHRCAIAATLSNEYAICCRHHNLTLSELFAIARQSIGFTLVNKTEQVALYSLLDFDFGPFPTY